LLNQLCSFTGEDGRPDDAVDVCSLIGRGLDHMHNASGAQSQQTRARWVDYGLSDDDDESNWKIA
jgi:hypothetical protein